MDIVQSLQSNWGWTLAPPGIELCNATSGWEENWEGIFDQVAEPKLAAARKKIKNRSLTSCIKIFEAMKRKTADWDAPPPETICKKACGQSQ